MRKFAATKNMKTSLVALSTVALAGLVGPALAYVPPAASLRPSMSLSPGASSSSPLSRRSIVKGLVAGIVIGGPVSALAEEEKAAEDKPKKKKLTPEEKAAEKARLEQQADENAQAFDASMGLFGCSFWGLQKKANSGACEPKPK